jgi:hypothetical protein
VKKQEVIEQRLRDLYDQHDKLTADIVLADASSPDSPLHPEFEWDDEKAGKEYRLDQARQLIRSVIYVYRNEHLTLEAPAYIRDPDAEARTQGYLSVAKVSTDSEISRRALVNELRVVAAALDRANRLAEAFGLAAECAAMRSQVDLLWRKLPPAA